MSALALVEIKAHAARGQAGIAFIASSAAILLMMATGFIGLYPRLLPSSLDPAAGLTVFNASSSPLTLKIMTLVVLVFIPLVIGCQIWVYRVFRKKIAADSGEETY